jgi:hypothetical protein
MEVVRQHAQGALALPGSLREPYRLRCREEWQRYAATISGEPGAQARFAAALETATADFIAALEAQGPVVALGADASPLPTLDELRPVFRRIIRQR